MTRLFLIFFFIFASVLTEAAVFSIKSDPDGSKVFIRKVGESTLKEIGVTPFTTTMTDLLNNFIGEESFILVVEKEDFHPFNLLMRDLGKTDVDLMVRLNPKEDIMSYRKIDALISELFETQRMIRAKQYDDSLKKLDEMLKDMPQLSIFHEFKGYTKYLQRDFPGALDEYKKAYRINPENRDAFIQKQNLEKSLNVVEVKDNKK